MARVERDEVLILGGVTHKNRGDLNGMMEGQFTQLREISPAIKPVFCSWNPDVSRRTYDVECRRSPDLIVSRRFSKGASRVLAIADIARLVLGFAAFHALGYRAARIFTRPGLPEFFGQVSRACAVVIHGSGSFNSY